MENMLRVVKNICGYRGILLESSSLPLHVACNYTSSATTNKSKITLPKLPVPALKQTLDKYLLTVKPFLNDTEYAKTVTLVKDFERGLGKKAQALLEKRAKEHVNWLEDWWLDIAYLEFRLPVVVFSNAGLLFNTNPIKTQDDPLRCAAKTLLGTLEYKALIDNNKIPQIMMRKKPLDMQQFKKVFGTCRIPWTKRDKLSFNNSSRHVAVIHNEHIFHLDLWGKDNILLSEKQIVEQLKTIVKNSESTNKQGVGILTSEHRDVWAIAYQLLSKDNKNQELLKDVQDSIVVLCLDAPCGYSKISNIDVRRCLGEKQLVHGGGSLSNGGNRWFDKTIQIVVGADGLTGITLEHAPIDGLSISGLVDSLPKYIEQDHVEGEPSSSPTTPKRLDFNVTPEVASMIKDAKINLNKLAENLDLTCFQYQNYGKKFIKSHKLSPDSFIQMAVQFAFYRLHKVPGAHYESATTAMFERGRTETIRSCSIESIEFAKSMLDTNKSPKEKFVALQNALESHKKYAVEAVQGMGIDRHLLGLKLAAITNGLQEHELYSDAGYVKSAHMRISTSQIGLNTDTFICFGPTVPDGYGIWYNLCDNYINATVSVFKDNTDTSIDKFKNALEKSLHDMKELVLQNISSTL